MTKQSGGEIKLLDGNTSTYEHNKARKETLIENYNKIASAKDITAEEFELYIGSQELMEANKHSIHRSVLRKTYNYKGVIGMDFVKKYDNIKAKNIYANLMEICGFVVLDDSFEYIRDTNTSHEDTNVSIIVKKHKVAILLTEYCGFSSHIDTNVLQKDTVWNNLEAAKADIMDNHKEISNIFKVNTSIRKWKYKNVMEWINSILHNMYGYKIMAVSMNTLEGKKQIIIKHEYYNNLFDIVESDDKPHVTLGWQQYLQHQQEVEFTII
jgi:hypothetical protein